MQIGDKVIVIDRGRQYITYIGMFTKLSENIKCPMPYNYGQCLTNGACGTIKSIYEYLDTTFVLVESQGWCYIFNKHGLKEQQKPFKVGDTIKAINNHYAYSALRFNWHGEVIGILENGNVRVRTTYSTEDKSAWVIYESLKQEHFELTQPYVKPIEIDIFELFNK